MNANLLVIGACGQIGSELTLKLRQVNGSENVVASDIKEGLPELMNSGPFELIDATNKEQITSVIKKYKIEEVYFNGCYAFWYC